MAPSPQSQPSAARPTNAEKDSKGEWLGFEGRLALYPIVTFFAGLMAFSALYSFKNVSFIPAAPLCFLPGAIVAAVVIKLVNKKPPGYIWDWLDTQRGASSVEFRSTVSRHPLADE